MLLFQIDYMAWADEEILRACLTLPDEELNRDLHSSHNGIIGTLRHMFVAEHDWLVRLHHSMGSPDNEPAPERFYVCPVPALGLSELAAEWRTIWPAFRAYIVSLPEAAIDADFAAMGERIPRWKLIQHVVNHATLHRAQVMTMLRQLGKQPPCTDLFEYHRMHQLLLGACRRHNAVHP